MTSVLLLRSGEIICVPDRLALSLEYDGFGRIIGGDVYQERIRTREIRYPTAHRAVLSPMSTK